MSYLSVKNWESFQHYKDRDPPWIKLHRKLLDNYDFSRLRDASKAHLILIWLLASQLENKIPNDPTWIKNKLGLTEDINIKELIDKGFLVVYQDASKPQAKRSPEREAETDVVVEAREHVEVGKQISKITGWDSDPNWSGDYGRIEQWLANGWDAEKDILPTVRKLMGKRSGPPGNLKYFEQAIADAHASRLKPLPEGKPHESTSGNYNGSNGKSRKVREIIADEHAKAYGLQDSGNPGLVAITKL